MNPLEIVKHWEQAVNEHQIDQGLALSSPQVELVGPQGSTHGHSELRDWLKTAGLQVQTVRSFVNQDHVVNLQTGVWHDAQRKITNQWEVATWYVVQGGRVSRIERFNELHAALEAAKLSWNNEQ